MCWKIKRVTKSIPRKEIINSVNSTKIKNEKITKIIIWENKMNIKIIIGELKKMYT